LPTLTAQVSWKKEPALEERTVSSLPEFITAVQQIRKTWCPTVGAPDEVWFRGQPAQSQCLSPRLLRPESLKRRYDESNLFERFKTYAHSLASPKPESDWEWYFLAQHHGLPTRLLDWTENAFAAVYFALHEKTFSTDKAQLDAELAREPRAPVFDADSPVVWLLDAGSLNKWSGGSDAVYITGGELTNHYLPSALEDATKPTSFEVKGVNVSNKNPIAVLSTRVTPRIAAQAAAFTVHGFDFSPIDCLVDAGGNETLKLARITFDRTNLARLWDELEITGVNRLSLFPDLDNTAKHLEWICWQ
jgi:FRG domain